MAKALYNVAYAGLTSVYTSPTGLTDLRTGLPALGGGMNEGDYFDLTVAEAANWVGTPKLNTGRYRFVRLSSLSTAANVVQGKPCGIAAPTTVGQVAIATAGSGQTAGTYVISSSASGGTALATAQVVVGAAGTITSATLLQAGAGFTSTPTFTVAAGGTPGTILAQMAVSENVVSSFDASAISLNSVRGVFLGPVTAAQITAGAYVFIQEQGIANVLVTTASQTTVGCAAATVTAGVVSTTTETASHPIGFLGLTLDVAAASTLVRVELALPVRQG
jgi:hypothetical protein